MNENFSYYEEVDETREDFINGFDHSGVDSGEFDDSQDFDIEDLSLGFINHIGSEIDGYNQYELIFTKYPDEFWGENFNYKPAGVCNNLTPDAKYIQKVVTIKTLINLDLIQDSGCFSIQDCMDGIVALAYQNLEGLDEYPSDGRIYFMFGEPFNEVERKLAIKHILIDI
jgi:hypothetical protein